MNQQNFNPELSQDQSEYEIDMNEKQDQQKDESNYSEFIIRNYGNERRKINKNYGKTVMELKDFINNVSDQFDSKLQKFMRLKLRLSEGRNELKHLKTNQGILLGAQLQRILMRQKVRKLIKKQKQLRQRNRQLKDENDEIRNDNIFYEYRLNNMDEGYMSQRIMDLEEKVEDYKERIEELKDKNEKLKEIKQKLKCPICLYYKQGGMTVITKCGHLMCQDCIDEWRQSPQQEEVGQEQGMIQYQYKWKCPICKKLIREVNLEIEQGEQVVQVHIDLIGIAQKLYI